MAPVPKKKHTKARSGKRRKNKFAKSSSLFSLKSKAQGISKKLEALGLGKYLKK